MNRTLGEDEASILVVFRGRTLEPDARVAPAGTVRFVVMNEAESAHDFVVIRSEQRVDDLPRRNGRIDDTALDVAARIEAVPPNDERDLVVELQPGRYVMISNSGEQYGVDTGLELTVQEVHGREGERV